MPNKPKPTVIKNLEGNPGKRVNHNEPQPRKGAPMPPHFLKGEALAEWGRIVPELEKIGMLSVVDRAALTAYCQSWASFVEATEDIRLRGLVVPGREGVMVKNPSVGMQRDALNQIRAWCTEFGLTPSARSRMQLPSQTGQDEDAEVLRLFAT